MATMIEVDNLGKKYRLGGQDKYYKTLRESLVRGLKRPFERLAGKAPEEDEFWALRNVSFTVDEGEVVGIIGRNGAGKSTLLKLLSRITRPTEGCAKLYGRVGSLLEVGTGFHPELTGRENIYLSGNLLGMTRAEVKNKFDEIVDFSGVEKFLDTPVKHYSSGMYVRLGFAIAAHLEPEILLVDEVLAVGDAQFQKKCLGKMDEVAKSGRTVLFVSHNLEAIQSLCHKGLLIEAANASIFSSPQAAVTKYVEDQSEGNSSNKNRPDESNQIHISLQIIGGNGSYYAMDRKDSFSLLLYLKIIKPVENFLVAYSFNLTSGVRVLEFRSNQEQGLIKRLDAGDYIIHSHIESLPLAPGIYHIDIGARSTSGTLAYMPRMAHICIKENRREEEWFFNESEGLVELPATWSPPESYILKECK